MKRISGEIAVDAAQRFELRKPACAQTSPCTIKSAPLDEREPR